MKYLLTNTVTYRVDTVAEVEKLHEEMKKCKIWLIVSAIIAGALAVVVIGFIALLFMAVAFM